MYFILNIIYVYLIIIHYFWIIVVFDDDDIIVNSNDNSVKAVPKPKGGFMIICIDLFIEVMIIIMIKILLVLIIYLYTICYVVYYYTVSKFMWWWLIDFKMSQRNQVWLVFESLDGCSDAKGPLNLWGSDIHNTAFLGTRGIVEE